MWSPWLLIFVSSASNASFMLISQQIRLTSQRGEVGIFLGYASASQYWVELVKSGILKRFDAARVLMDETVPDNILLSGSTRDSLSLRVGEGSSLL